RGWCIQHQYNQCLIDEAIRELERARLQAIFPEAEPGIQGDGGDVVACHGDMNLDNAVDPASMPDRSSEEARSGPRATPFGNDIHAPDVHAVAHFSSRCPADAAHANESSICRKGAEN